jgi:antitoxin VapB
MALYIRDSEVDALAVRLQEMTDAPTKTEAVRKALENEIKRKIGEIPLEDRLGKILDRATALGLPNADFDMKKFSDELSGEDD